MVTINRSICSCDISRKRRRLVFAAGKEEVKLKYTDNDRDEFKKALMPAVDWLQKHGCPHDKVIIQQDGAEFVSGEIAFSVEVPD